MLTKKLIIFINELIQQTYNVSYFILDLRQKHVRKVPEFDLEEVFVRVRPQLSIKKLSSKSSKLIIYF